jgi:hypothetical protein
LPWSWRSRTLEGGDYANPAEISLYALSWVAAYEMQKPWSPDWPEVEAEVTAVLDQLRAWQTGSQSSQPHGPNAHANSVFYQWYWIGWDPPVVGGGDSGATNQDVPAIDNAWLAVCLLTLRSYAEAHGHAALGQKADAILSDMDFSIWYDYEAHLFYWGDFQNPMAGGYADYYSNENRLINFVARALDQLDAAEFQMSLDALVVSPAAYDGVTVGAVAWDGSLFTYLSPALFLREVNTTYGSNTILPAVEAQIAYAQDEGYGAWGLSDCFDRGDGGYIQQGAPPAASPNPPETNRGLVAPHASALALITPAGPEAITNLLTLSNTLPISPTLSPIYDDQYGFRDCVMMDPQNTRYGEASERFSALAQEWLFLSIVNAETDFIGNYLYRDAGVQRAHSEMYETALYFPLVAGNYPLAAVSGNRHLPFSRRVASFDGEDVFGK